MRRPESLSMKYLSIGRNDRDCGQRKGKEDERKEESQGWRRKERIAHGNLKPFMNRANVTTTF